MKNAWQGDLEKLILLNHYIQETKPQWSYFPALVHFLYFQVIHTFLKTIHVNYSCHIQDLFPKIIKNKKNVTEPHLMQYNCAMAMCTTLCYM